MKEFRHAGIVVADMERALGFYRDLLGLTVVRDAEEQGEYRERITGLPGARARTVKMKARNGSALVELLQFHTHPRPVEAPAETCAIGLRHIAFTVEDLDSLHRRLTEAGVRFLAPPQRSPSGREKITYCRDPEGNILELVGEIPPAGGRDS